MEELMTASPSVGAYRAEPMTANEIDAHPDAARIWATVMALRQGVDVALAEIEERIGRAKEEGEECGIEEGRDEGRDEALDDVAEVLAGPGYNWPKDKINELLGRL